MPLRFRPAAPLLIACALVPGLSSAQDARDVQAETYIRPVPIERPAPSFPREELSQSREGWVMLSYVIGADGNVAEPMIENSSGGEAFGLRLVSWFCTQNALNRRPLHERRDNYLDPHRRRHG